MLRTAFMGSPAVAVPCLHATAEATDLRVVVSQPDRPAGRGRKLTAPPVKQAALERGLPVVQPRKMRDGTLAARLREHDLDLIVVVAFGRILPREILDVPRHGCINVHFSILPRWRGAAPVQRAVLAGDAETGVAIMRMEEGLDTGPVFRVDRTPIGPEETSGELFDRLARLGGETLGEFLGAFPDVPDAEPQDDRLATHAAMLEKAEGAIDWGRSAAEVAAHVRGMDPWPGAFAERGSDRLKIFGARVADWSGEAPAGTVLGLHEDRLLVATGAGAVLLRELQPPGKKRMPAAAYVAGKPFADGERLA